MQCHSEPKLKKSNFERDYFLLDGIVMPGMEKIEQEILFPEEKQLSFSTVGRKDISSEGNIIFLRAFPCYLPRNKHSAYRGSLPNATFGGSLPNATFGSGKNSH